MYNAYFFIARRQGLIHDVDVSIGILIDTSSAEKHVCMHGRLIHGKVMWSCYTHRIELAYCLCPILHLSFFPDHIVSHQAPSAQHTMSSRPTESSSGRNSTRDTAIVHREHSMGAIGSNRDVLEEIEKQRDEVSSSILPMRMLTDGRCSARKRSPGSPQTSFNAPSKK